MSIRAQPALNFALLICKECASSAGLTPSVLEQPALAGQHLAGPTAPAMHHCRACSVKAPDTARHRCACPGAHGHGDSEPKEGDACCLTWDYRHLVRPSSTSLHVLLAALTCLALMLHLLRLGSPCKCSTGALDSPSEAAHGLSSARPCNRFCWETPVHEPGLRARSLSLWQALPDIGPLLHAVKRCSAM